MFGHSIESCCIHSYIRQVYGFLFSEDVDVVKLVAAVMPLVASFQIADGLAGSCGGVLRGQGTVQLFSPLWAFQIFRIGRQHLGAVFNFIAYYVLALPMGITLAFHGRTHLGLQGLWIGERCARCDSVAHRDDQAKLWLFLSLELVSC